MKLKHRLPSPHRINPEGEKKAIKPNIIETKR
jgi:hypothetical protein